MPLVRLAESRYWNSVSAPLSTIQTSVSTRSAGLTPLESDSVPDCREASSLNPALPSEGDGIEGFLFGGLHGRFFFPQVLRHAILPTVCRLSSPTSQNSGTAVIVRTT